MAITRVKNWIDREILTASDLNAEFNNLLDNSEDNPWPATKAKDFNGFELILDGDGDTSITADTDDQIDIRIAGVDDFRFTANTFTALSGSSIATNTIAETTAGSGVTIDGLLIKDGAVASGGGVITDTITESTPAAGVTIDGLLLKDLTIAGHIIGTDIQAWDTQLDDIAALAVSDGNIIVGDGANWVAESGATARTSLGVAIGTDVLAEQTVGIADDNLVEVDGDPNSAEYARFTANGLEGRTEAEFKADFNLEIGTDVQAFDATYVVDADIGVSVQAFDTDTAKLDVDQSWTGTQSNTFVQLTDAGPVVVDFATGNNFYVTVTADRQIGAPSNKTNGQSGTIIVEQDAGGTNTTTWHADWDFGDTGNPTPDETGNKKAVVSYVVDWDSSVKAVFAGDF